MRELEYINRILDHDQAQSVIVAIINPTPDQIEQIPEIVKGERLDTLVSFRGEKTRQLVISHYHLEEKELTLGEDPVEASITSRIATANI